MQILAPVLLVACLVLPSEGRAEYNITLTGNDLFALCSGRDIQTIRPSPTAEWQCREHPRCDGFVGQPKNI